MFEGSEKIDMTLMIKRAVNVFQIPPITSSAGHRAEDWRGKQMWTGFCRVLMEDSKKCKIQFINQDNSIFAQTAFTSDNYQAFVQRCVDSSRFFAVLIINDQTQQKANIGVQFPERNDSFDFIGALDQYVKYYLIEQGLSDPKKQLKEQNDAPLLDFQIKKGEKITLNIKGVSGQGGNQNNLNLLQEKPSGLKPLKKPLQPLSKPPQQVNSGFGGQQQTNDLDLLLGSNLAQNNNQISQGQDLFSLLPSYSDNSNSNLQNHNQDQFTFGQQKKNEDPFGFADFFDQKQQSSHQQFNGNNQQSVQNKNSDPMGFDDLFG